MNEPTEAQIEELWEWCGVTPIEVRDMGEVYPRVTLNNLFRYAVPKLLEEYNIESYSFRQDSRLYYSETNIWRKGSTKHSFEVLQDAHVAKHFEQGADLNEITALALFWAIWEVIKNE